MTRLREARFGGRRKVRHRNTLTSPPNCPTMWDHLTTKRNADEPDDWRMAFRIGVNLDDVIIEGDDLHGEPSCGITLLIKT